MPSYNFKCEDCDSEIELQCSISEYPDLIKNIRCPGCSSVNVHRDYSNDNIYSSVREIKTIGQLAEFNTKKMGSKLQEEYEKNKPKEEVAQWYQNSKLGDASRKEINKMTKEQKKRYVLTGKK